jgi:hypothetical protein
MKRAGHRIALIALAVGTTVVFGASAADAKPLGGITSATISASTQSAATGAPTVLAYENFTGANGTNLNGATTDGGGKTWSVNPTGGAWTIQGNAARSTTANTSLVIDAGSPSDTVVVTLFRNGATTFDAGLTINRNAAGTQFLTAEWTSTANGSLELWKFTGGAWTEYTAVTNLYPGGIGTAPASIVLSLSSTTGGVLSASINGVPVVSTTLSAGDQTTFKNATHQLAGPYQWTSNGITFDDFHLDNP